MDNQAMAFLGQTIEPAFQSLDNLVSTVPKTVKARLRIVPVGYGSRLRDCVTCCTPCNAHDPVLGEHVFIMWAHLEDDGITIQGFMCFFCAGVLRRRYRGWELKKLVDEFKVPESTCKEQFLNGRKPGINFIQEHGFKERITQHVIDGGVDKSKRSVSTSHKMNETYHLKGDLLFQRDAFVLLFKNEPEAFGFEHSSRTLPDGEVL